MGGEELFGELTERAKPQAEAGPFGVPRLREPQRDQIELRAVVPTAAPTSPGLCGGEPAGTAALLHRGARVDLMLFRAGVAIGPATPPSALCGAWSFTAR